MTARAHDSSASGPIEVQAQKFAQIVETGIDNNNLQTAVNNLWALQRENKLDQKMLAEANNLLHQKGYLTDIEITGAADDRDSLSIKLDHPQTCLIGTHPDSMYSSIRETVTDVSGVGKITANCDMYEGARIHESDFFGLFSRVYNQDTFFGTAEQAGNPELSKTCVRPPAIVHHAAAPKHGIPEDPPGY